MATGEIPEGVRVHLKLDTGHGPLRLRGAAGAGPEVVGLMTHLATADSDTVFAEQQLERFREATDRYAEADPPRRQLAPPRSGSPTARFDAARCGVALYGLSPFGTDPAADRLEPVLSLAQPPGAGQAARGGREHRLRPRASSPRRQPGSGSSPSAMRTASAAT